MDTLDSDRESAGWYVAFGDWFARFVESTELVLHELVQRSAVVTFTTPLVFENQ